MGTLLRSATINLFCATAFLLFSCTTEDKLSHEDEIQKIKDMSAARAAAFNEGNAAAIAIHFTDDGILMAPEQAVAQGRTAVEAYYQKIFDLYDTELKSGYEEVEVSGDLAFGRGFAEVRLHPKDGGESLFSTSKYINILKKQKDGAWKTTHDIWNGNE
ncbi:MAG: SgcJ/EcaC family oxidoreductase [Cyclobacteriaceae bacterium]|nr:SgcJ/EcaC family oxidoreductase [Cyclobacteriaceae bacterium]